MEATWLVVRRAKLPTPPHFLWIFICFSRQSRHAGQERPQEGMRSTSEFSASLNMGENKAVEVVAFNAEEPWQACRLGSRPKPSPPPGHVVVRILCRSVNPSDILSIRGLYLGWRPPAFPAVPGLEGMGVIDQVGEGVSNVEVGQRVFPMSGRADETGQGLWQEYIVVPAPALVPIPPSVPDEVAAQFLVNPWTVVGMIRVLQVPKGDYLLQTAAASALGRMLIQYAHHLGIKTINVVRRKDQVEELKALGAYEVINSTEEDVVEKVNKVTGGKMVHSAIDCVGGETTSVVVKCTRDGGTILIFGVLGAMHIEAPIIDLIFRDIKLHGYYLTSWISTMSHPELVEISTHVMGLLEKNIIIPMIGEKFPLHQFKEAIKKTLEPGRGGKVLLVSS